MTDKVRKKHVRDPGIYVFIDDADLWSIKPSIDFGRLLLHISQKRGVRKAVIARSIPPLDSFWRIAHDKGIEVFLGGSTKATIADLVELVCTVQTPATIVLVAGAGDYGSALKKAIDRKWIVEVVFCNSNGIISYSACEAKGTEVCHLRRVIKTADVQKIPSTS